ncbi:MAG: aminopeptidase P family protein [Pseudomonadota bacterium]
MFQSFTSTADRNAGPARLGALQLQMKAHGITAFLVPHADEHQGEYLPERAERLAWLTGFTGSAGFAIATPKTCVVFVDGRYTLQVKEQVHPDSFDTESLIETPPSKWLEQNTDKNDVIGYDPWLITTKQICAYEKACKKSGATLKPVENLIDRIWDNQPDAPLGKAFIHPVTYAGKPAEDKLAEVRKKISERDCQLTVLTDPASIAWLFNIRGSDIEHNPLALCFAIVPAEATPIVFIDEHKFDGETRDHLENLAVISEPDTLVEALGETGADTSVLCDPNLMPVVLAETISKAGGKIVEGPDPVILLRAVKNVVELEGARQAHIRDGVAMCKFLCWLDSQNPESLTEISAARKLEELRAENALNMDSQLKEISFDTISGHGPNGAIVHYRVTEETNRRFENNSLYLCDSGGQYVDGTTDITRTIAIGNPPEQAIRDFTLVLKGHIAIATARFPEGTRGVDIDVLARHALWQHGRDFAHGTGHGVGSYLNVHEGPQSISRRGTEPFKEGMIISNEPGYYMAGEYGIRIENLVIVGELEGIDGGNTRTHAFETITLAPIDHRLINPSLLTPDERNWLNHYHKEVREKLSDFLENDEQDWLRIMTAPI